jgi:hypothetical protein
MLKTGSDEVPVRDKKHAGRVGSVLQVPLGLSWLFNVPKMAAYPWPTGGKVAAD